MTNGASDLVVEYRTRNLSGRSLNVGWVVCKQPQQVANVPCAQANSASYPQWDGKYVAYGLQGELGYWLIGTGCTTGPVVRRCRHWMAA